MNTSKCLTLILLLIATTSCKNESNASAEPISHEAIIKAVDKAIKVTPISHGTLVLEYEDITLYVDPVGGKEAFTGQKSPNIVLVTDIHGDHLNNETLAQITTESTKIVVPAAVAEKLTDSLKSRHSVLVNFESKNFTVGNTTITVEGIPMYNLRDEAKQFHAKGRGNGYVLTLGDHRVYVSGDTEDIPEMRQLKAIDMAFVCMNLPWTMPVEAAASAVLDFKPKIVYPYHYRGTDGLSDVNAFNDMIVAQDSLITVRLENWYPNR